MEEEMETRFLFVILYLLYEETENFVLDFVLFAFRFIFFTSSL